MVLIIGGYAQGKKAYAKDRYPDALLLEDFNALARSRWSENKECLFELLSEIRAMDREKGGKLVVISREIGNGIVPVDPQDRAFREWMGRLQVQLAAEAVEVIRICCGLAQKLK